MPLIFIEYNISKTHGFFICMGGFVSRIGHHPVTAEGQLRDVPEYLTDIRAVEVEDIKDKSKGDALSKGVALFQGLWFTTQCLARVRQNLPVTELEVATLAFAVVNVFIWLLWWNKPLDVQRPILVGPMAGSGIPNNEPVDNQVASLLPAEENLLEGDAKLWQAGFWDGINGPIGGTYKDYKPTSYSSVPSFWSTNDPDQDKAPSSLLIEYLIGTVFGAIHCAAWNVDFASIEEMWMWRSCSVLVAASPVVFGLSLMAAVKGLFDTDSTIGTVSALIFFMVSIPLYIIARLFLIVLPLVALRALPPGALMDVNWSVYIPHL